jgi:predicted CopG family antitoxin
VITVDYTTIQISTNIRNRLTELKDSPRQTYDEVLEKLIELVPKGDEEGEYKPAFRGSILRGLLDARHSKTTALAELEKQFGT